MWVLILCIVAFAIHQFMQLDDGCNCEPDGVHQQTFDDETGFGWPAAALVYLLACVAGLRRTAWITLAVDAVLLGLGAYLIAVVVAHPEVLAAPLEDNCVVREPFLVAALGAAIDAAIDLVALRPVFRRLRGRSPPRRAGSP